MKKIIFSAMGIIGLVTVVSGTVFAQNGHTAREEAEGKVVWEKPQAQSTGFMPMMQMMTGGGRLPLAIIQQTI